MDGEHPGDVLLAGDVGRNRQVSPPSARFVPIEGLHQLLDLRRRPSVDENGRAVVVKRFRDAQSGVAGGTGYQNIFSLKHGVCPCADRGSRFSEIRYGLGRADVGQVAAVVPQRTRLVGMIGEGLLVQFDPQSGPVGNLEIAVLEDQVSRW